jgi:hypothetical protein
VWQQLLVHGFRCQLASAWVHDLCVPLPIVILPD